MKLLRRLLLGFHLKSPNNPITPGSEVCMTPEQKVVLSSMRVCHGLAVGH